MRMNEYSTGSEKKRMKAIPWGLHQSGYDRTWN